MIESSRHASWLLTATIIAATAAAGCGGGPSAASNLEPVKVEKLAAFHPPVQTRVTSGDTIESLSRSLAGEDWVVWRDALMGEIDARRLLPGTQFRGVCSPAGRLERLDVIIDRRTEIHFRAGSDGLTVERIERPIESEVLRLEGTIQSSLFGAMDAAGGGPELAVMVAQIYQWDIDFLRDLRQGDSFVVIVDRQTVDGEFYAWGTIFAARFINGKRTLDAVIYPDDDGRLGYYDLEGRPLRKQFLRSPLKFSRITSRFSMNRFHPILRKRIPHFGVDYGAPVGTPVLVTADGKVTFAGRKSGGGNMVTVRHTNGYETNYLHLSKFGRGVQRGTRVSQGQIIGYVGATGLANGPHLDYRVTLNGKWVNPLTISQPAVEPLSQERLQRFLAHALSVLSLFANEQPPVGARC